MRPFVFVLLFAFAAGCMPGQPRPVRLAPDEPEFSEREFTRHLGRLQRDLSEEALPHDHRRSFERYAAARMAEFGLQPAFGPSHAALYYRPELYPRTLTARAARQDGREIEVAGLTSGPRSGIGTVSFREVWFNPGSAADLSGKVVVIAGEETSGTLLEALYEAGARAVFIVGTPRRRILGGPFPDLLVIRADRSSAANVLGITSPELMSRIRDGRQSQMLIPNRVVVDVDIDQREHQPKVNILGLAAGKIPHLSRELVIVGAEYDGLEADSEARSPLPRGGAPVAAVLELARHYGRQAQFGPFPERTVLFALWSGADLNHLGTRAYLESPVWPAAQVKDVILLTTQNNSDRLSDLWEARGYRVSTVPRLSAPGTNGDGYIETETAEAMRLALATSRVLYHAAGTDPAPLSTRGLP